MRLSCSQLKEGYPQIKRRNASIQSDCYSLMIVFSFCLLTECRMIIFLKISLAPEDSPRALSSGEMLPGHPAPHAVEVTPSKGPGSWCVSRIPDALCDHRELGPEPGLGRKTGILRADYLTSDPWPPEKTRKCSIIVILACGWAQNCQEECRKL